MERGGAVYILSNKYNKVLYTGVTSSLNNRIFEHKEKLHPTSFTARYNTNKVVYFKGFNLIKEAIAEEKRIKGGSRIEKIKLIESINPEWNDLYNQL
ncbi:MAG: endonuclease [Flavobacteriales bacterium]|nr:MAG: endonuclease [Flavobacteriales bacterium]